MSPRARPKCLTETGVLASLASRHLLGLSSFSADAFGTGGDYLGPEREKRAQGQPRRKETNAFQRETVKLVESLRNDEGQYEGRALRQDPFTDTNVAD
jgi:hypothetical protein